MADAKVKLTATCPRCENDLAGGIAGGGLDLSKQSCHMCGYSDPVVTPALVPVAEVPAETPEKVAADAAAVEAKPEKKKAARRKPAAKKKSGLQKLEAGIKKMVTPKLADGDDTKKVAPAAEVPEQK